ncbi:hypothetical protein V1514DRAFT_291716 [Lipomyces japonicus]|uniref:uncharacterized protein n=1 Tax=Lipomyces japonicus TaxID=56871 RepID=UPI0034D013E6
MADSNQATVAGAGSNVIDIPLRDDQEVVTLNLDTDLPDDPTELCDLLDNEEAGRQFWLAIGTAYSRLGKIDEAIEVVNRALEAPALSKLSEQDRAPLHGCLAWLFLKQSRYAPKKAPGQTTVKTKDVYHQLATQELNIATKAFRTWTPNLVARGVWHVLKSSSSSSPSLTEALDEAGRTFDDVIKQVQDTNLLASLGRARVLFSKQNYKAALKLYQNVLAARQDMVPDPRIGIGLCFWKLGFKDDARIAWERVVELDPDGQAGNVLLGLYFHDKAFQSVGTADFVPLYGEALKLTQKAYHSGNGSGAHHKQALAGISLAAYLFAKRTQMDSVIKLCEKILDHTDVPSIISDAHFWIGRAYHSQSNYERAMQNYQRARSVKPDNVLAKVAIGQLQIINKDPTGAKLNFEKIIQEHPKCAEAMLILGYLYADDYFSQSKSATSVGAIASSSSATAAAAAARDEKALAEAKRKSKVLFEKYLKLVEARVGITPVEVQVNQTLSRLYEDDNVDHAIESLKAAIGLQKRLGNDENTSVPVELENNLGVLSFHKGLFDDAKQAFSQSLKHAENDLSTTVTLTYNLARLEEQVGKISEAKKLYESIDQLLPGYVDARLRLCYIALRESEDSTAATSVADAVAKVQALVETESGNLEVRALHGWYLHQHQRKRPAAKSINDDIEQRHYKHTLQYYDKHDLYSLTSMGNIFLSAAREMRVSNEADADRRRKTYERAVEFFDKALQLDSGNAYAAQGIAIALAEDKKYSKAASIFGKIRETLNDVSSYINLAHCLAELKNYGRAIECYEIALEKFQNGSSIQTIMCLGRVWLQRGLEETSLESVKTALAYSHRALKLSPNNLALKFNVAYVHFQITEVLRRMSLADRTMADIESAAAGLEDAITALTELKSEPHPPFPAAEIEQRATMGQNTTRKQLERLLAQQREFAERTESKLEAARKLRDAAAAESSSNSNDRSHDQSQGQQVVNVATA